MILEETLEKIKKPSQEAMERCRQHWDSIAKPLHSLGKLEDALVRIAGMTGNERIHLDKKALVVMCADNGVVEEGVTQTGQEITALVCENFLQTKAVSSIMCKSVGAEIFPVDVGVASNVSILNRKIAYGTKNMVKEPAMTKEQAVQAIETGIEMVETLKAKGYGIIATGEMGIGNTTTSSAVVSVLLDESVENVTGRGAGLSSEGLNRKIQAIQTAIEKNQPDKEDILDVLFKVGGLDIAGMTGAFLGGAIYHIPVLIDGFISSAAALCAVRMVPETADYILASHCSGEPAGRMVLEELKLPYLIDAKMSLGEGSGAVAAIPLLEMGVNVYRKMSTFEEIKVEQYEELK